MKSFWTAILAISIIATFALGTEKASAMTRDYVNEYKGIYTGVSTKRDVVQRLGKPVRIEKAGGGQNYRYEKVKINFPKLTDRVNTIIIDNDYGYTDPNGLKIGDSVKKAKKKVWGETNGNTIRDYHEGIIYWIKKEKIDRIVLTHSLVISVSENKMPYYKGIYKI